RERVGGAAARLAGPGALQLALELVHAAEQVVERDAAVLEDHLGGVRGPDAELGLLLALLEARRSLRHDERRLTAVAECWIHSCDDDVDIGDSAVGDEDLRPVQDPLVAIPP